MKKATKNRIEKAEKELIDAHIDGAFNELEKGEVSQSQLLSEIAKKAEMSINEIIKKCGLLNIRRDAKLNRLKHSDIVKFSNSAGFSVKSHIGQNIFEIK